MDDDHALAERLDVGHVVARQHHGRLVPLPVLGDERADALLHRDVEAERRLVEEQHGRPVEERADDLDLHPLAQRELPNRLAHEVADLEQLDQLVPRLEELLARDAVDRAVELERVERRQVPLELVAVAHDQRDAAQEVALALRGHVAEHARLAGGDVEQPREHLQRRRLAGAVRAEEADDLAGRDVERDAVDGLDLPHPAADEALRRRLEPRLALGHVERLAELRDVDDRLSHCASASRASSRTPRRGGRSTGRAARTPRR